MDSRYQDYLAAQIFSDGRIISYRALSRAFKVHSNAAKQMLFEFHRTQNARKPGSLHATYLIGGRRKPVKLSQTNGTQSQDGEDSLMAGSSFMSSSMPGQDVERENIPITTITLVMEEDLEVVREGYDAITSIHVYSLEPGPLNSIQILSDCNRKIAADHNADDLLETWKQYGTIHNPMAKRRTGARPPPPIAPLPQPITAEVKVIPKAPAANSSAKPVENVPPSRRDSTPDTKTEEQPTKKTTGKPPTLKRDASNIFKSFAKTKVPLKKDGPTSDVSVAASPAPSGGDSQLEDVVMKDGHASDDDFEFEAEIPVTSNSREAAEKSDAARKAKTEREAALRKMMDDDEDELMDDLPPADEASTTHSLPLEPTLDAQSLKLQDVPSPSELDPNQATTTTSNGRRRGRRKVMKKKTTRDAEGYLVTREEAAWESFSEDEPVAQQQQQEPAAKKQKGPGSALAAAHAQGEKGANAGAGGGGEKGGKEKGKKGKPGQGNIMSFFAKK